MSYDINFKCPRCHKKTELEKTSSGTFAAAIKQIDVSEEDATLGKEITESLEKNSSSTLPIIKQIFDSEKDVTLVTLEEEITDVYEEYPEHIQCSECGFVLRDENRNCIIEPEDLYQYLKNKNMLQRKMGEAQILKNIYNFIQNADGDEIARVFEQIMGEKCYYDGLEYIQYPKDS